jgi:hypothetical protein
MGRDCFSFEKSLWRRFLALRQDADPHLVVDKLIDLFPEVIAWWEDKAGGPHLGLSPAVVRLPA